MPREYGARTITRDTSHRLLRLSRVFPFAKEIFYRLPFDLIATDFCRKRVDLRMSVEFMAIKLTPRFLFTGQNRGAKTARAEV